MAAKFQRGDKVVIRAVDAFFSFVDGWHGRVSGYMPEGYCKVVCQHSEGEKVFFVPDAQLEKLPA